MTNPFNTVIYIGVTNDLVRRVYEHKNKLLKGFSSKYNLSKLVYYEIAIDIEAAILREKQLKAGSRKNKLALILKDNPEFDDLYESIL